MTFLLSHRLVLHAAYYGQYDCYLHEVPTTVLIRLLRLPMLYYGLIRMPTSTNAYSRSNTDGYLQACLLRPNTTATSRCALLRSTTGYPHE